MKLNAKGIEELRNHILELLENVPEGKRIKLDKELLDDLIFFKGKNKHGQVIKVPVWTGTFLRKLDLSKLSFKNVYFGIGYQIDAYTNKSIKDVMDAEPVTRFKQVSNGGMYDYVAPFPGVVFPAYKQRMIDFSLTNIKIDFNEIYGNAIECTDFSGVDLSNSNASAIKWAYNCSFSHTALKFDFSASVAELGFNSCDFSYNNFKDQSLDAINLDASDGNCYSNSFNNCDFNSTGLSIINVNELSSRAVSNLIKNDKLNGCYVNGVYIKHMEERGFIAKQKHNEYLAFQKELFANIDAEFDKQIKSRKK